MNVNPKSIRNLQKRAYANKVKKGFNVTDMSFEFERLREEIQEAQDTWNKHETKEEFGEELADCAIYLLGMAEMASLSLEDAIIKKMARNEKRIYEKINGSMVRVYDPDSENLVEDTILFVTSNPGKVSSANRYFEGILKFEAYSPTEEIPEIRGSLEDIAKAKAKTAYEIVQRPVIVMDSGFSVEVLNGFPGPYVNNMLLMGVGRLLKAMEGEQNRNCAFTQALAYFNGNDEPLVFRGVHEGKLAIAKAGTLSEDDWSELSLVFIPKEEMNGRGRTLAQLTHEERALLSQSSDSTSAFESFREWYTCNKE